MVKALFGVVQAGLISVTINYRLIADEASYIVENSGSKLIICDEHTSESKRVLEKSWSNCEGDA